MFCLDWLQAGRATRGKPRLRTARPPLLAAIGIAGLSRRTAKRMSIRAVQQLRQRQRPAWTLWFLQSRSDRMFTRSNHAAPAIAANREWSPALRSRLRHPQPSLTPGAYHAIRHRELQGRSSSPGRRIQPTELGPVDPTAKSKLVPPPGNGAARASDPRERATRPASQDSGARIARRRTDSFGTTTVSTPEPTGRSAPGRNRAGPERSTTAPRTTRSTTFRRSICPAKCPDQSRRRRYLRRPLPPPRPRRREAGRCQNRIAGPSGERPRPDLDHAHRPTGERRPGAQSVPRRRSQVRRRQLADARQPRLARRKGLSHTARSPRIV